jgi:hypothetical protein
MKLRPESSSTTVAGSGTSLDREGACRKSDSYRAVCIGSCGGAKQHSEHEYANKNFERFTSHELSPLVLVKTLRSGLSVCRGW